MKRMSMSRICRRRSGGIIMSGCWTLSMNMIPMACFGVLLVSAVVIGRWRVVSFVRVRFLNGGTWWEGSSG